MTHEVVTAPAYRWKDGRRLGVRKFVAGIDREEADLIVRGMWTPRSGETVRMEGYGILNVRPNIVRVRGSRRANSYTRRRPRRAR